MSNQAYAPEEPFREPLPRMISNQRAPENRFDDYIAPDYFWSTARWLFLVMLVAMGGSAIKDLYYMGYIWYLPMCWAATFVAGYAGFSFVEKYRAK